MVNSGKDTISARTNRICCDCGGQMKLIQVLQSYVGTDANIYKCIDCDNTEKVTKVSRAWLFTTSRGLRKPD